jgi:hypothetical protein
MAMQQDMVKDLLEMESDLGSPTFFWGATEYPCSPSISEVTRDLGDAGGFTIDKILSMTVRLQDADGNSVFDNDLLPQAQQIITYNTEPFRIVTMKVHPTKSSIRIMAVGVTRGL